MSENTEVPLAQAAPPDPALADSESEALRSDDHVHLAWRLLTSPRTFFGVASVLAAYLIWAAVVPDRATPMELSRAMTFAEAEFASALGVSDPWSSWVFLLGVFLLGAVGIGVILARPASAGPFVRRSEALIAAPVDAVRARAPRGTQLGLRREGAGLVLLGLVALLIALGISRGSGLEARIQVVPGDPTGEQTTAAVLDGPIYVPRAFARVLRCGDPDPLDASRSFACELGGTPNIAAEPVALRPGEPADAADLTFTVLRATRRFPDRGEVATFVVRRGDKPAELVGLTVGTTVALTDSGEHLQSFSSPDGPLVLVTGAGHAPYLLAPALEPKAPSDAAPGQLQLAYAPPRSLTVRATTNPERALLWAGIGLIALGLFLFGVFPSLRLEYEATPAGTRVICWSTNDLDRATRTLAALRPPEAT